MNKNTTSSLRRLNGVLLLDKPINLTSNAALQIVKRIYKATKAGHTGSLDPLASGMLPLCFGEATKFAQFLLEEDKSYHVVGKLGVTTTTGDAEGEIIATKPIGGITSAQIKNLLPQFSGAIEQLPSMYSAIKYQGQPLYKLARQGITIERQMRQINIYDLKFIDFDSNMLTLFVHCSKGTYIRTLISDIGDALGCGAHVTSLRRLSVGSFQAQDMVAMETLQQFATQNDEAALDSLLLPIEVMLRNCPELRLTETMIYYLTQGSPIMVPHAPTSGYVKLKTKNGEFLGIGEILADGKVAPRRLIKLAKKET